MSRTVKTGFVVLALIGTGLGAYAWSWSRLAHTHRLYEFAAADAVAGRLDWTTLRPVVAISGFGGGRDAHALRELVAKALTSQGRVIGSSDGKVAPDLTDEAMDMLAAKQRLTAISASVVRLHPLDTAVRVRWTNGDHAEIHEFGFWWNGASWIRRPGKDQRSVTVTVYQASNLTARCSGRTRVSRRLRGKRRATRRAAERDR